MGITVQAGYSKETTALTRGNEFDQLKITPAKFTRHYMIPLPWRGQVVEQDESDIPGLLEDGVNNIRVQGPDQSMPLALRSLQDLSEFKSFASGKINSDVSKKKLAKGLLLLNKAGVKIVGYFRGDRGFIGPYGAYNALTGAIGVSLDSAVLGEGLPTIDFSRKEELTALVSAVKFVDDLFEHTQTSKEARRLGEQTLLAQIVRSGQSNKIPDLDKIHSVRDFQQWHRLQLRFSERALRDQAKVRETASWAIEALRAPSGRYEISFQSSLGLIGLGFEEKLRPLEFMQKAMQLAPAEDRNSIFDRLALIVLQDPQFETPKSVMEQAERGELSRSELKEVIEELQKQENMDSSDLGETIKTEENLIIVGDEELEVDL